MTTIRYLFLHADTKALLPVHPSYAFAERLQSVLQQDLLAWKASPPSSRGAPPSPSVIYFSPAPTYTLGRRQTEPLSESEAARLRSPLFVPNANDSQWFSIDRQKKTAYFLPTIAHAPRGGLTTYHGPGQLVIWPVIDLHSPLHAHLTVRDYACLLEKTTIAALAQRYGIKGFTTENPGVWVRPSDASRGAADERKVAALGVHLRRHVTGLGVSINYSTPVTGPPETNPWGRIVPCGLGDRRVTSVCAELGTAASSSNSANPDHVDEELEGLAAAWQMEFVNRLKLHADAAGMVRAFDAAQNMEDFRAQSKGREDTFIEACPISSLET